jgi:hypothetical protein
MISAVDLDVKIQLVEAIARNIVIEQVEDEFVALARREEEMRVRRIEKAFPRSAVARRHGAGSESRVCRRQLSIRYSLARADRRERGQPGAKASFG